MIQYYLSFKKKKTNFLFLPATIQGELKFLKESWFKMASTLVETENKKMRKSNKEMGPHQTYILLHSKGKHKENKKMQTTDWEKDLQMIQLTRA